MKVIVEHEGQSFTCDANAGKSIAITLDFEGPQPNHFGTDKAKQEVLKLGSFVGDTTQGGSCNVNTLTMIPHCNGTHTETISHIVNEDIWIGHAMIRPMMVACLCTVRPERVTKLTGEARKESYRPALADEDTVITSAALDRAFTAAKLSTIKPDALLIRTLPNEDAKRNRAYGETFQPPFFTVQAMERINETSIRHLLVDMPSVDRMYDDGLLTNHHLFWKVQEQSHKLSADAHQDKTITEMIFVPDECKDGIYLLNLQIPALATDAAPSRPVLFPATRQKSE